MIILELIKIKNILRDILLVFMTQKAISVMKELLEFVIPIKI
jgi:hypothetical protein